MVFLVSPCKLTRLVKQAVKGVSVLEFRYNASVCPSENGSEASGDGEFRAHCHLEELSDWLSFVTSNSDRVLGNGLQGKAIFVNAVINRKDLRRLLVADWIVEIVLVAIETKFTLLRFSVDEAKVANCVLSNVQLSIVGLLSVLADSRL